VSASVQETALANWLAAGQRCIGQISIMESPGEGFGLIHRDDASRNDL
jgi:hypothetical protein